MQRSQVVPEEISSDDFNAESLYIMQKQLQHSLVTLVLQPLFTVFHRVHCLVLCHDILDSYSHSTSTTILKLIHSYTCL